MYITVLSGVTIHVCLQLDGELEFINKAKEGMNDDEAQFSVEFPLDTQAFMWSDKYRPRKPRFFNRVHTVSVPAFYIPKLFLLLKMVESLPCTFCIFSPHNQSKV